MQKQDKELVKDFWDDASCGELLLLKKNDKQGYMAHSQERYRLEPYIDDFAEFERFKNRRVLEIGVGLGADHQKFAEAGAILTGIDLTSRAVEHTQHRFDTFNLHSDILLGDGEKLSFGDNEFDLVYSWGVIHHSPDTPGAVQEIYRVLKPGGQAKVMIYHKYSLVGFMLWLRYGLMRGMPLLSLEKVYANYLESPGTKAYSLDEGRQLFSKFRVVKVSTVLTHGDLLSSGAGQRHSGPLLTFMRYIWPRRIIKRFAARFGLFMLINAEK